MVRNNAVEETWADIRGYEGYYQVSTHGQVRSIARLDTYGRQRPGVVLQPAPSKKGGYLQVCLKKGRKDIKTHYVHRLVAIAFLPNPYALPQINHKNADKTDNKVTNLEWCSASHNMHHAQQRGLLRWFHVGYDPRRARKTA